MAIKIGVIGAGRRAIELLAKKENEELKIVGVFDTNNIRANFFGKLVNCTIFNTYQELFNSNKIDAVFIMCRDDKHIFYIKQALKKNLMIFCEKPICTTLNDINYLRSLSIEEKMNIKVLFNSRFMPINRIIKKAIEDYLGQIYTINYSYLVDIDHGAEYFHRWHSERNKSESLLVHKGAHHIDLVNWWISDKLKKRVIMNSYNLFKGKEDIYCRTCNLNCPYRYKNSDSLDIHLYFKSEVIDGYKRDKCVFSSKNNVADSYSVSLLYDRGTLATYSLNFLSTYHGFDLNVVGEYGNLKANIIYSNKNSQIITLNLRNGKEIKIPIRQSSKKHFGADQNLIENLIKDPHALASIDEALDAILIEF